MEGHRSTRAHSTDAGLCTPLQASRKKLDSLLNSQSIGSKTFRPSVKRTSSFSGLLSATPQQRQRRRVAGSISRVLNFPTPDTCRGRDRRGTPNSSPRSAIQWRPVSPSPKMKVYEDEELRENNRPLPRRLNFTDPSNSPEEAASSSSVCEPVTIDLESSQSRFVFGLPQPERPDRRASAAGITSAPPIYHMVIPPTPDLRAERIGSPCASEDFIRAKRFPCRGDELMTPLSCSTGQPSLVSPIAFTLLEQSPVEADPIVKAEVAPSVPTRPPLAWSPFLGVRNPRLPKKCVDAATNTSPASSRSRSRRQHNSPLNVQQHQQVQEPVQQSAGATSQPSTQSRMHTSNSSTPPRAEDAPIAIPSNEIEGDYTPNTTADIESPHHVLVFSGSPADDASREELRRDIFDSEPVAGSDVLFPWKRNSRAQDSDSLGRRLDTRKSLFPESSEASVSQGTQHTQHTQHTQRTSTDLAGSLPTPEGIDKSTPEHNSLGARIGYVTSPILSFNRRLVRSGQTPIRRNYTPTSKRESRRRKILDSDASASDMDMEDSDVEKENSDVEKLNSVVEIGNSDMEIGNSDMEIGNSDMENSPSPTRRKSIVEAATPPPAGENQSARGHNEPPPGFGLLDAVLNRSESSPRPRRSRLSFIRRRSPTTGTFRPQSSPDKRPSLGAPSYTVAARLERRAARQRAKKSLASHMEAAERERRESAVTTKVIARASKQEKKREAAEKKREAAEKKKEAAAKKKLEAEQKKLEAAAKKKEAAAKKKEEAAKKKQEQQEKKREQQEKKKKDKEAAKKKREEAAKSARKKEAAAKKKKSATKNKRSTKNKENVSRNVMKKSKKKR